MNAAFTQPNVDHESAHRVTQRGLSYQFGRFHALTDTRRLLLEGEITELCAPAFDLLIALIEARGKLVTCESMFKRLRPGEKMDPSFVWVQMSRLRTALRDDGCFIKTVPGQGYVFAADVAVVTYDDSSSTDTNTRSPLYRNQAVTSKAPDPTVRRWLESPGSALREDDDWRTVILIDDDSGVRDAVQSLLRSAGLRAVAFNSIQQFVTNIGPNLPGCLLLDIMLPDQSGLDFFEGIARANVYLPVIFITGHADIAMSVKAMKFGATDFLVKPVQPQDLLNAIQLAIESAALGASAPRGKGFKHLVCDEKPLACRGGLAPWQERRAKESMMANLSHEPSIASVAAECAMSRSHFGQAFKRSTGMTPREWLSAQKIIKAKELLLCGTSLADAAQECGFSDQSHFTRVFAAMVGAPPGAWLRVQKA